MKILIISHYYKHKNAMASVRAIKLSKYFAQMGNEVTVLASLQKDNWCKQEVTPQKSDNINEIYAPEHKGMQYLRKVYSLMKARGEKRVAQASGSVEAGEAATAVIAKKSLRARIKGFISWFYYYSCDRLENRFLYLGFKAAIKANKLSGFDAVIATYPGAGAHLAGVWMKKHRRTKKFIADYRDPAYNPGGRSNKIELRHDKKIQNKAVFAADHIVCVSNGMAETLAQFYKNKKIAPISVVNNGFDLDDHKNEAAVAFDKAKFNFVYTGALYNGRRTVVMLAEALRSLIDEGETSQSEIAIHYAGSDYGELLSQLKPFGLEGIAVNYGFVSRSESLSMQANANMVLLLNWNQDNYTGVIPGKIYEYMASRTPICALIMGNEGNSETAKMITEDKLGVACEEAVSEDRLKLKAYLADMLSAFHSNKEIRNDISAVEKYNYKNLSLKYLEIIKKTLS